MPKKSRSKPPKSSAASSASGGAAASTTADVLSAVPDSDIGGLFSEMLGAGDSGPKAPHVIYPKYLKYKATTLRYAKLLRFMSCAQFIKLFPDIKPQLEAYCDQLDKSAAEMFDVPDFDQWLAPPAEMTMEAAMMDDPHDYSKIPKPVRDAFLAKYAGIKECSLVNTIMVSCQNLLQHKKYISNLSELSDKFIMKSGMATCCPIPDMHALDFKLMYIDMRLDANDRKIILTILHKIYTIGHEMYNIVSSPDIDIADFVKVIMGSISEVKKRIPRCDEAFQKIEESVGLLDSNFSEYHKDYAASGNPTVIMERFVSEVAQTSGSTTKVASQFKQIIKQYRLMAAKHASNPKIQRIFATVDATFAKLEATSDDASDSESSDDDDDDDDGIIADAAPSAKLDPVIEDVTASVNAPVVEEIIPAIDAVTHAIGEVTLTIEEVTPAPVDTSGTANAPPMNRVNV